MGIPETKVEKQTGLKITKTWLKEIQKLANLIPGGVIK